MGRKRKASWGPCARCGDPDGPTRNNLTPIRIDGSGVGFEGIVCVRCYSTLKGRVDREPRKSCRGRQRMPVPNRAALPVQS